ncbi:magnesium/cobalt transporter CorA [Planctomicrobium sp. SH668]|uniref:magnesium/cobalt transporter CorA n=1 Tax=Planctomicrobium sp. SH668 TaxID=3448126 RepID=UPI003F5BBEF9
MGLIDVLQNAPEHVRELGTQRKFHRRTIPGAAPGTLVSDTSKHKTQMRLMIYGGGEVIEHPLIEISKIPEPTPGHVMWLDVSGLADADVIGAIGKKFRLHPLALEDVLHIHQRAKTEEYPEFLFIVARMLQPDGNGGSEQVSMFLGKNFVITFQEDPGDCFDVIRERIRKNGQIRGRGPDYLVYGLLDSIIDAYFPRFERIGAELDEIDDSLTRKPNRTHLSELHEIRRHLIQLRKLLWQHRDSLNTLVRQETMFVRPETQIYLRDTLDHVVQLIDVSETDRDSCTGLQELYLSELSQKTNDVVKVLTLFSTVFMPMTFIAGVYGMNFRTEISPMNMPELDWYYGYPFSLALMFGTGFLMLIFFWWRGWFRR